MSARRPVPFLWSAVAAAVLLLCAVLAGPVQGAHVLGGYPSGTEIVTANDELLLTGGDDLSSSSTHPQAGAPEQTSEHRAVLSGVSTAVISATREPHGWGEPTAIHSRHPCANSVARAPPGVCV